MQQESCIQPTGQGRTARPILDSAEQFITTKRIRIQQVTGEVGPVLVFKVHLIGW